MPCCQIAANLLARPVGFLLFTGVVGEWAPAALSSMTSQDRPNIFSFRLIDQSKTPDRLTARMKIDQERHNCGVGGIGPALSPSIDRLSRHKWNRSIDPVLSIDRPTDQWKWS
jgi:hypothetical protein